MSRREIEQYLYFASVFDDDMDMMAHALIQLGGVHVKPSRLKDIMLVYNVTQYMGIMGEITNMKPLDIVKWKCSYFDMVLEKKKKLVEREIEKLEELRGNSKCACAANQEKCCGGE
jgi:hypothetical protein